MGKRKAKTRKAPGPKKQGPLATSFTCLFCNHEHSVQCKLDKKAGVGDLYCKTCGQKFQTTINFLSAAVDVYADWIDACELVAKDAANEEARITKEDRAFSKYADEAPIRSTNAGRGTSEKDEVDAAYESDY